MIGIYKIINLINNKVYIGSSVDITRRLLSHKNNLLNGKSNSIKLQNAYNKYGSGNFEFQILEECLFENLIEREQYYIDLYNSYNEGYNCCPIAGNTYGYKHPDEMIEYFKQINSGESNPRWGKKHTEESLEKMRINSPRRGKPSALRGIPHTEEWKNNLAKLVGGRNNYRYNPTPVLQYDLNGNFITEWLDMVELKSNGFNSSNISKACKNGRTSQGFRWKFKEQVEYN